MKLTFYGSDKILISFFSLTCLFYKQKVNFNNYWSEEATLQNGVPQVLGPFFLLCVNDLPSVSASKIWYADDTSFLNIEKNQSESDLITKNILFSRRPTDNNYDSHIHLSDIVTF